MNYQKGQAHLRPMLVSLKLDPADARLLDNLQRARRQRSCQATIIAILREYDQLRERTQEERVENIEWRRLYFDLAESTSELRHSAEQILEKIENAAARDRNDRRRRLSIS